MFSSSLLLSSPIEDSNLESFIHCITPTPPSRSLPQSCIQELNSQWQPLDKDIVEYFTLEDLWNCYYEWSAYGAGTPVVLNNSEEIMQYYVPYLSAIQIYTNKSVTASRTPREDTDAVEFESDSWSDDSGSDKLSRSLSNNSSRAWDAVSEDSSLEQEGSWPTTNKLGNLYFQYFEMSSPYWRVPLSDKVTELARNHPGLMSLRSVDLLPASWMSVAWYPIYHIPSRKNEKDLSTCFLTYHTLSSSFQDSPVDYDNSCCSEVAKTTERKPKPKGSGTISLTPFGLATYKMQGDLWVKPDTSDEERLVNLHCAADSWLKQLNVQHHDFNFFSSHSTM
ncbi:Protein of unknown function (DUF789) [Melia azedarach]|uniref:Uncharacterized protein n=2 Tax=Melia azedarach TaxID=155640 RepID=A0ACC1XQR8_MELAZ|nr:Protein of unknown function (DUF789) [Melia azedarach]KAJ4713725.1 Protein of unknown function (DUF789) [Melia azedarach]